MLIEARSLDSISKNFGPVRVDVLGKIAEAILGGLTYLYEAHRIMHRDIKPSNVVVNSRGQIKLCDFGVSSELVNSVADTFVGTGTYMAPERIQGSPYTVKSDVWSVGLTLMELAIGKFPFSIDSEDDEEAAGPQGILDLLQQIVLEPAPKLPKSDAFPSILDDVIAKCMMKAPEERPTPKELFDSDPFLQAAKRTPVDLQQWAISMMEKHNRKSHLVPPLSPSTRALLRGEDTPSTVTPTVSSIPIATSSNGTTTPATARPAFPTRSSSAQQVPAQSAYAQPMNLPIRQAPPASRRLDQERPDTAGSDRSDSSFRRAPRAQYPEVPRAQYPEPSSRQQHYQENPKPRYPDQQSRQKYPEDGRAQYSDDRRGKYADGQFSDERRGQYPEERRGQQQYPDGSRPGHADIGRYVDSYR
jgi:mitogen-activated protein kinase kinase